MKIVLLVIVIIPAVTYISLQIPAIQTVATRSAVKMLLSNDIDGKIEVERVYMLLFNRIYLRNVSIKGSEGDTLVLCNKVFLSVPPSGLWNKELKLNRVKVRGGSFNLIYEDKKISNMSKIFRIDHDHPEEIPEGKRRITAKEIVISDFNFRYFSKIIEEKKERTNFDKHHISFTDLDLSAINIRIKGFKLKDAVFSGKIERLSCLDKSGFRVNRLSADMEMGFERTIFRNLRIDDNYSDIVASSLSFEYGSPRRLNNFTENVVMEGVFKRTRLNFISLGKIVPELTGNDLSITLDGKINGTVSGLYTSGVNITPNNPASISTIFAEGRINGIATEKSPFITLDSISMKTNRSDISYMLSKFIRGKDVTDYVPEANYLFDGSLRGPLDSLNIIGLLSSDIGSAGLDIVLFNNDEPEKRLSVGGRLDTDELDLGAITKIKGLRYISLNTDFELNFYPHKNDFSLRLSQMDINSLLFNEYTYSDISMEGLLTKELFDGTIRSADPNMQLTFDGSLSLAESSTKSYQFDLDLPYISLSSLNFEKRFKRSEVSLNMSANIKSSTIGDYIGNIRINDINLANDYGSYDLGKMDIISYTRDNMLFTTISSSFLKTDYRASGKLSDFAGKIGSLISTSAIGRDLFPAYGRESNESYYLDIKMEENISELAQFIMPELFISPGSNINIRISPDNNMELKVNSEALGLSHNYIKSIGLNFSNRDSLFLLSAMVEELSMGSLKLKDNLLEISGKENNLEVQYGFSNNNGNKNSLELSSLLYFQDIDIIRGKLSYLAELQIDHSNMTLQDKIWDISPASIFLGNKYYEINGLKISNGDQKIALDGAISNHQEDILRADVTNFDLSIFNSFSKKDLGLKGILNGSAEVSNLFRTPNLLVDLYSDSVSIYQDNIGSLRLLSKRDLNNDNINILIENRLGDLQPLNILGSYQPNGSAVDVNVELNSFPLSVVELFTDGLISQTKGSLSCVLNITQDDETPLSITGRDAKVDNFSFLLDYTNVPYTLSGLLDFDKNSITIKSMDLRDRFNNSGTLSGRVNHNSLKNFNLDSRVVFQNMQCLNTVESNSQPFYGNAFAGGTINIGANKDKILLDINVTTSQNSTIHIPMKQSGEVSRYNILTFEEPQSEIEKPDFFAQFMERNKKSTESAELEIKLRLGVTENTEVDIEIDKATGDVLRATGSGIINMDINPSNNLFNIKGNYTIDQGSYKFVYLGFGSRDFIIQNGGTIMFNGDITNAALDIVATYRTKATIAPLIGESSDYRRNVDCSVHMGGRLSDPELKFSIDIPDLAPSYRAKVESALSTEDKILTQFMALMITGSFVVNEGGQGVGFNNATILYSNASEIISNQVSNIFRQLGIPLDLGFNYQVDSRRESEMFDMAISTQLFNNRVVINGSIGSTTQYNTNRDIAGDIDIEIKLDQDGRVRLNLFSHSADPYTNYLDDTQRNGLGIIYQNEFNNFKEMINNIFLSRKKREELEEERIREIIRVATEKKSE